MPRFRSFSFSSLCRVAFSWLIAGSALPAITHAESVIGFQSGSVSVFEDEGFAKIPVFRSGDVSGLATVEYSMRDVDAVAGTHYDGAPGTVTFSAGQTTAEIVVPILENTDVNHYRRFDVFLGGTSAGDRVASTDNIKTVYIKDNDGPGEFRFEVAESDYAEGSIAQIKVLRQHGSLGTATVSFWAAGGTAESGIDYVHQTGTLIFEDGVTEQTISITLPDDALAEPSESFRLFLSAPSGAALSQLKEHTVYIHSDEPAPTPTTVHFTTTASIVAENASTTSITLRRTGSFTGGFTVSYSIFPGTAEPGLDYAVSGTCTFLPDQTFATLQVPLNNDQLIESPENFSIVLTGTSRAAVIGHLPIHLVTLVSDDGPTTFTFVEPSSTHREGEDFALKVLRSGNLAAADVAVAVLPSGTTVTPDDYVGLESTIHFAAGTLEGSVSSLFKADDLTEGDETLRLELQTSGNAQTGQFPTHEITVTDYIRPTFEFTFTSANSTGTEGSVLTIPVTVTRTGTAVPCAIDIVATPAGTAAKGSDFLPSFPISLEFGPYQSEQVFEINLSTDALVEGTESIVLQLIPNSFQQESVGAIPTHTITLLDANTFPPAGEFSFSAATTTVNEGATNVSVTVHRTGATPETVIHVALVSATATLGADYQATLPVSLHFAEGETEKTVPIQVASDLFFEGQEQIVLQLAKDSQMQTLGAFAQHIVQIADGTASYPAGSFSGSAEMIHYASAIHLTLGKTGIVTGSLQLPGKTYRFRKKLGNDGSFTLEWPEMPPAKFQLSADGLRWAISISGLAVPFDGSALRRKTPTNAEPIGEAGVYTGTIGTPAINGVGCIHVAIDRRGRAITTFDLVDGLQLRASTFVAEDGSIMAVAHGRRHTQVSAKLTIDPAAPRQLSGQLWSHVWTPALQNWSTSSSLPVSGARYQAPARNLRILDDFDAASGAGLLRFADAANSFLYRPFTWFPNNRAVVHPADGSTVRLQFNAERGTWSGTITARGAATQRMRGVCIQQATPGDDLALGFIRTPSDAPSARLVELISAR